MEMMSIRAEEILNAAIGDSKPKLLSKVIAYALYASADRLCTDWGELQHPADVLREIADEILELDKLENYGRGPIVDTDQLNSMEERIVELERQVEALNYVTDVSDYYE